MTQSPMVDVSYIPFPTWLFWILLPILLVAVAFQYKSYLPFFLQSIAPPKRMPENSPRFPVKGNHADPSRVLKVALPTSDDSKFLPGTNVRWEDPVNLSQKEKGASGKQFSGRSQAQMGLLVTEELHQAITTCKSKVERIAKACRAGNRKFRDIEFDLENDQEICLYGLNREPVVKPIGDVRRVSKILENPKFFAGEPRSSDIRQGDLGDCWFLSAVSCVACSPGLLKKICVARDEEVGVYGFIFFKDTRWVDVIVDDQLCCSLPKFEGLSAEQQELYHEDKDLYKEVEQKRGKGLTYAHSGTAGETWVPLIEKAYAKLIGDYASLESGHTCDGIEDLTGGISVWFGIKDILDTDVFWKEELLHANKSRMFSVRFVGLESSSTVNGLMGSHAYAILRAKECEGKRFIVIRNPWGSTEWNGAWSDGSKEWTEDVEKGIKILNDLDHVLGDDGQFVMEYSDFLKTWEHISRTTIFDKSWIMSAHWLCVPPRPLQHSWTFGEVVYYLSVPKPSHSVISLSRLDGRDFKDLGGQSVSYNLDFVVYNLETKEKVGESYNGRFWLRGTTCEVYLDKGDYAIYPRIDRSLAYPSGYVEAILDDWNERKLSRVLMQRTRSRSIALSNYQLGKRAKFIPISVKDLIDFDNQTDQLGNPNDSSSDEDEDVDGGDDEDENVPVIFDPTSETDSNEPSDETSEEGVTFDNEDEHSLFLCLRVYTKKGCPVDITGRLANSMDEGDPEEDEEEADNKNEEKNQRDEEEGQGDDEDRGSQVDDDCKCGQGEEDVTERENEELVEENYEDEGEPGCQYGYLDGEGEQGYGDEYQDQAEEGEEVLIQVNYQYGSQYPGEDEDGERT